MALSTQTQVRSLQVGRLIREGAFVSQARQIVPTLSLLMGERVSDVASTDETLNAGAFGFESLRDLSNEARLRINLRRRGANAIIITSANANLPASTTPQNIHEAYEIDTTKFILPNMVAADELQLGEGGSYMAAVSTQQSWVEQLTMDMFNVLGGSSQGIWSTATGTPIGTGRLGSIPWIVSDGLTTVERGGVGPNDSAYEVYLGVDRSAVGNEFLRSGFAVEAAAGFNLARMNFQLIQHRNRGGASKGAVVILPAARYAAIQSEVNFVPTAADDQFANQVGLGEYFKLGGAIVTTDGSCPSDRGYILDPQTWTMGIGFVPGEDGVVRDRTDLNDAKEIRLAFRAALACTAPQYNTCIFFS